MMEPGSDIFKTTLAGLELGLHVRDITTYALDTCGPDEDVEDVLREPRLSDFDCIPVRENASIAGYVQRTPNQSGRVRDTMRPIEESILVSADLPLTRYVELITEGPFRLVLDGAAIRGIVTWSDLQKLPVRLFAFTLVTHLEMLMMKGISVYCPDPQTWLLFLPAARQGKVRHDFNRFQHERLDPPLIEFASFGDKRRILTEILNLDETSSRELEELKTELRDKVAHAGGYAETPRAVREFARRLELAKSWIERLTDMIAKQDQ